MTTVLLILLFFFVYPFTGYPALMWLVQKKWKRSYPEIPPDEDLPTVALLICAYNEEKVIGEKVRNSLALRYPAGKLRIVVVTDGCSDRTVEVVRREGGSRITLLERSPRHGKIRNINETVLALEEDIVVSTDANVLCHPDAIRYLARNFQDPTVGCVSGQIVITNTLDALAEPERQFFSMEWCLQEAASQIYSMPGVDGAMYAFRRHLFRPLPSDTIIEDFVMSMGFVRQGTRIVFEPMALARENGAVTVAEEFRRKVRIAAGAAQGLVRRSACPWGAPLRFWSVWISHKLLRWLTPITGGLSVLGAIATPSTPLSRCILMGAVALLGAIVLRGITKWRHPLLDGPYYFLLSQAALALGLGKGLTGTQSVLWAKPNR